MYGIFDEKCPTSSGYGRPDEHLPYVALEHCPCTDLFSFLVSTSRRRRGRPDEHPPYVALEH